MIEQVHYNLLVGDKPVTNRLGLDTVPVSTPLLPKQSQYLIALPNIPCPVGVTGPLCNYQASLNYLNQRFGSGGVEMAKGIDQTAVKSRTPRASATRPRAPAGRIERLHRQDPAAHAPVGGGVHDGALSRDAPSQDHPGRPGLQLPLPKGVQRGADPGESRRANTNQLPL